MAYPLGIDHSGAVGEAMDSELTGPGIEDPHRIDFTRESSW